MFRPSLTAAANAPMQQHAIHALSVRAPMSSLSQIPSWRSRHVNATFVRDLVRRDAANAAARATMIATMMMREHARATIGERRRRCVDCSCLSATIIQLVLPMELMRCARASRLRKILRDDVRRGRTSLRDRRSIFFRSDARAASHER